MVTYERQHLHNEIARRDETIARLPAEIVLHRQTIDSLCRRIFGASSEVFTCSGKNRTQHENPSKPKLFILCILCILWLEEFLTTECTECTE